VNAIAPLGGGRIYPGPYLSAGTHTISKQFSKNAQPPGTLITITCTGGFWFGGQSGTLPTCAGSITVTIPYEEVTCYQDADGDGCGKFNISQTFNQSSCPDGWVTDNSDCYDDSNIVCAPFSIPYTMRCPCGTETCRDGEWTCDNPSLPETINVPYFNQADYPDDIYDNCCCKKDPITKKIKTRKVNENGSCPSGYHKCTIQNKGCFLCSIAMILNFYWPSQNITVPYLNDLFIREGVYTDVGGICLGLAISALKKESFGISPTEKGLYTTGWIESFKKNYLNNALCIGIPIIAKIPGPHFIVLNGVTEDGNFRMEDPGHKDDKEIDPDKIISLRPILPIDDIPWSILQASNLFPYHTNPRSGRLVTIRTGSSVQICVINPQGKKVGIDPDTGVEAEEMTNAYYGLEHVIGDSNTVDYKFIEIFTPVEGTFTIKVIGTETGSYQVEVDKFDTSGILSNTQTFSGQINAGETKEHELTYTPPFFYYFYKDADNDGYGDPNVVTTHYDPPEGFVGNCDDCNDNDPNINPDADEIPDGIDNDCDDEIDEGGAIKPNLLPYKPQYWDDKIVVSNKQGTYTDDNNITECETVYIDYAYINNGEADAKKGYKINLYIDNNSVETYTINEDYGPNVYWYRYDFTYNFNTSGNHIITLIVDEDNNVIESNEGDNEYSKNIYVNPCSSDTIDPVVTCPAAMIVEATGASTLVTYQATATDNTDPNPIISYTPIPGSGFPIGTTLVTVTATDAAGNSSTCTFTVTVVDTTPPELTYPDDMTIETTGAETLVDYPVITATDIVDPDPEVSYNPAPGTEFPLGTTEVTVTATDAEGNSSTCTFTVTVKNVDSALIYSSAWLYDPDTVYIVKHNQPPSECQQTFDELTTQGYRLLSIDSHVINDIPYYATIYVYDPDTGFMVKNGQTTSACKQSFDELTTQGYRLLSVDSHVINNTPYYATIYMYDPDTAFLATNGQTFNQYQQTCDEFADQGYRLISIDTHVINDIPYYASAWVHDPDTTFWLTYKHNASECQQTFDELTAQGYRLLSIDSSTINGTTYYASAWLYDPGTGFWATHNQTYSQYQQTFDELAAQGFRPLDIDTVLVSGDSSDPIISVTPSTIDFGTVSVGSFKDNILTITNIGGGILSGNATTSPPFSIISGNPYNLAATQSQEVVVKFSPTAAQTYSGDISFDDGCGATRTVSVTGVGEICTYSISPNHNSFDHPGGTGSISVTTQSGCAWTAVSDNSWITITSGDSGAENDIVYYSVLGNSGTSRTGTITIKEQIFTISQNKAPTTELCNGIDDDLDGYTDEEGSQGCILYYKDSDKDEYGVDNETRCLCNPEHPYTAIQGGDCNDSDDSVYPDAPGTRKGKDNDCNGTIDNDEKKSSNAKGSLPYVIGGLSFGNLPYSNIGSPFGSSSLNFAIPSFGNSLFGIGIPTFGSLPYSNIGSPFGSSSLNFGVPSFGNSLFGIGIPTFGSLPYSNIGSPFGSSFLNFGVPSFENSLFGIGIPTFGSLPYSFGGYSGINHGNLSSFGGLPGFTGFGSLFGGNNYFPSPPPSGTSKKKDTTPPELDCPSDMTVQATGALTSVTYEASATDNADHNPMISYNHEPGYSFPIGTTTVTVTAADDSGNKSICSFTGTVKGGLATAPGHAKGIIPDTLGKAPILEHKLIVLNGLTKQRGGFGHPQP